MSNFEHLSGVAYSVGETAALRELLLSLSKGMRACRQYPPEHPIPQQFKHTFRKQLAQFFEHSERLLVKVNIDSLETDEEIVYRAAVSNDNIAQILHRDGVRSLEISSHVSDSEIDQLFDAFVICSSREEDRCDIVNKFWEAGFEHIKYEVVDSFEVGEIGEVFTQFGDEEPAAAASGGDKLSFSPSNNISWPVTQQEVSSAIDEQQRLMVEAFDRNDQLSDEDRNRLDVEIQKDRSKDLKREVVDLLLQLSGEDGSPQDLRLTVESLQSTFDRLIEDGKFGTLREVLKRIRDLLGHDSFDNATVKKRYRELEQRCGDSVRLKQITNVLNKRPDVDLILVESYLNELGWESLNSLLWMLGELAHYPARKMLCDLLVHKGFEKIDILGSAVFDSRWYVVRNVVWVLGEMKTVKALPYLTKAAKHAEPRVKIETLRALSKLGGDKAAAILLEMIKDDSEKVRSIALRELGTNGTQTAFRGLEEIVFNKEFVEAEQADMRMILEAFVLAGGDAAVTACEHNIHKSSLFNKAKLQRFQDAIIYSLGQSSAPSAVTLLTKLESDPRHHIATAAKRALAQIKISREIK